MIPISIEEKGSGAKITSDSKVTVNGFFMRSIFAMMNILADGFNMHEAENFGTLKVIIEKIKQTIIHLS